MSTGSKSKESLPHLETAESITVSDNKTTKDLLEEEEFKVNLETVLNHAKQQTPQSKMMDTVNSISLPETTSGGEKRVVENIIAVVMEKSYAELTLLSNSTSCKDELSAKEPSSQTVPTTNASDNKASLEATDTLLSTANSIQVELSKSKSTQEEFSEEKLDDGVPSKLTEDKTTEKILESTDAIDNTTSIHSREAKLGNVGSDVIVTKEEVPLDKEPNAIASTSVPEFRNDKIKLIEKILAVVMKMAFSELNFSPQSHQDELSVKNIPSSKSSFAIKKALEKRVSFEDSTSTARVVNNGYLPGATEELAEDWKEKVGFATVMFRLMPSERSLTLGFPIGHTVHQLKQQLTEILTVSADSLRLTFDGLILTDEVALKKLMLHPKQMLNIDVFSTSPDKKILKIDTAGGLRQNQTTVGSETSINENKMFLEAHQKQNAHKKVVVEIVRSSKKKPFLGGYRHKLTGVEFHHASAQTQRSCAGNSRVEKFSRDSQTAYERTLMIQTNEACCTQMTKVGCYVSNVIDRIIVPGTYITAESYFETRLKAIIVIQAHFRRWQARNTVEELKHDRYRRVQWLAQEELRKKKMKDLQEQMDYERRMNPKTKSDFNRLFAALENWRIEELGHINEELEGPERKAALCALLEQEAQLIASIGRHKSEVLKKNKEKQIEQFLTKAAAPKRWKAFDGNYTVMVTPDTILASQLKDVYNSIGMNYITQDERLDVLLTLKHTVKDYDCKLTREIVSLIDRETDLMMRGVSKDNLQGLRKRISTLFFQYCKNPLFNPEAARLLKAPRDLETLRKNVYYCKSSKRYLPSSQFNVMVSSKSVGKCKKVEEVDNTARERKDYSFFRRMLLGLRRREEEFNDNSNFVYLIHEKDLRYLIENVWGSRSILSAWDDPCDLVMVRWDKEEEWSPWNCILLTKEETKSHLELDHLEEAYGREFILKVKHKHSLARIHFSKLPGMSEQLRRGSQKMQGPGNVRGKNTFCNKQESNALI